MNRSTGLALRLRRVARRRARREAAFLLRSKANAERLRRALNRALAPSSPS